jgi:hypothetical protein
MLHWVDKIGLAHVIRKVMASQRVAGNVTKLRETPLKFNYQVISSDRIMVLGKTQVYGNNVKIKSGQSAGKHVLKHDASTNR